MVEFLEISEFEFCTYRNRIYDLDDKYFPNPWSIEQWYTLFQSGVDYKIFTLIEEETLIGFSLFGLDRVDNFAHLLKICLNSTYYSLGHGSELLKKSISELSLIHIERIYLEVAIDNTRAIKLYNKHSFKELCVKKHFYSDGTDAYAMQRLNE